MISVMISAMIMIMISALMVSVMMKKGSGCHVVIMRIINDQ